MRTIDELVRTTTGEPVSDELLSRLAAWPPDLLAVTSTLLSESGAYRCVVSPPDDQNWPPSKTWQKDTIDVHAREWRKWVATQIVDQDLMALRRDDGFVHDALRVLSDLSQLPIHDLAKDDHWSELCGVLTLHALADEVSSGLGLEVETGDYGAAFVLSANQRLTECETLARFPVERVRVLPKMRTPQLGMSIRSISHHVAAVQSEVGVTWHRQPFETKERNRLRLLLVPWPFSVSDADFKIEESPLENMDPDRFGFFSFVPGYSTDDLLTKFSALLDSACKTPGQIDGVVLPETAITPDEFKKLWDECAKRSLTLLISGVRDQGTQANSACLRAGKEQPESLEQHKHHRWCLDGSQIKRYEIGTALNPACRWWERMPLQTRRIHVAALNDWLTLCHLVCEDLARMDPVAEVVRAMGPTLVVALLLDGPQLKHRWPARYATVLVEDPGCSVLTLTSLGMAMRSRVDPDHAPDRTIALWGDATQTVPIKLENNAEAAVITLWCERLEEFTADGRSDRAAAARLVLGGVHQVSLP